MRRFLPKSLIGQIALVMAIALADRAGDQFQPDLHRAAAAGPHPGRGAGDRPLRHARPAAVGAAARAQGVRASRTTGAAGPRSIAASARARRRQRSEPARAAARERRGERRRAARPARRGDQRGRGRAADPRAAAAGGEAADGPSAGAAAHPAALGPAARRQLAQRAHDGAAAQSPGWRCAPRWRPCSPI